MDDYDGLLANKNKNFAKKKFRAFFHNKNIIAHFSLCILFQSQKVKLLFWENTFLHLEMWQTVNKYKYYFIVGMEFYIFILWKKVVIINKPFA